MKKSPRSAQQRVLRALIAILAVHAVVLGAGWLSVGPAMAAGNGVLDLELTPVNLSTGDPITETANGSNDNRITYRIQYSCTTAACENAEIQLSPSPADPHGLLPAGEWILKYDGWVAPSAGGSIDGTDISGKTIQLGTLAAGTSGSLSVTYAYQATRNREVPNGSFYPDGFQIEMSGEISSPTAVASVTRDAAPVTWRIGTPAAVTGTLGPNNATFDADTPVTYRMAVNPGNMTFNPGTNNAGSADLVAAGNYEIVSTLPTQAVVISASHGGVIDHATNTVTWTKGSVAAPSYGARGGWGPTGLSGYNSGGAAVNNALVGNDDDAFWQAREVVVSFPGTNFPEAVNGCNFTKQVTSTLDVTVNYLDTARTQRTMNRSLDTRVACTTPFAGVGVEKLIANGAANQGANGDGNLGGAPAVLAVNVPAPGETDTGIREWRVRAANQGNVAATAIIDEPTLSHDHIRVHQIRAYAYTGAPGAWQASVEWEDNTGATGTALLGNDAFVDAAPGRWFVSARTTAPLAAGRTLPGDTTSTQMQMGYRFRVDDGAAAKIGEERTNTVDVTLEYPADADGDGDADNYTNLQGQPLPSRAVTAEAARTARYTQPTPTLTAAFTGSPVVAGGATPVPGTEVTYQFRALTTDAWPGTQLQPQMVFVAPPGWDVIAGSAQFVADGAGATTTAPAGVTFDYATRTINGTSRSVVIATWPTAIGINSTSDDHWPTLQVRSTPTAAAVAGAPVAAIALAGDAHGTWRQATTNAYLTVGDQFRAAATSLLDAGDLDADGDTGESFASAASTNLIVGATDGLLVVKELCIPDASAADGCAWAADPSQVHSVPVAATDVKYRLRLTNAGNTSLGAVVAYDVLPHVGDTGLLANPPVRGSEFAMTFDSVESVSPGVTVDFSDSTNPARPEVNPTAAGTVDDWAAPVAGKKAIRLDVGSLPAGQSREVVFLAAVAPGAQAEQQACNTVAADSAQTLPAEPLAVCVQLADADLSIELADTDPLVPGNAGTLSYRVTNHGGNNNAPGAVTVDVPNGVTVVDLTVAGWDCTAPGGAPATGPATLSCLPVTAASDPRTLVKDVVDVLALPIEVSAGLAGATVCMPASVSGPLHDPVLANNETDGCRSLGEPKLTLVKAAALTTDGGSVGVADKDDVITYTFTVTNDGPVPVSAVSITDALPGLSVTTPSSVATLTPGADAIFTATYTVTQADVDHGEPIVNRASAAGLAPDDSDVLSPEDTTSTDVVPAAPQLSVVKTAALTTDLGTPDRADVEDVITYTFTVTNDGNVTMANVAIADDLPGLSTVTPVTLASLAPGADADFVATYVVTQADIDAGGAVHNSATATGRAPDGTSRSSDPSTTDTDVVDAAPALDLDKVAVLDDTNGNGFADRGETIDYTFVVENTGNVTIDDVTIEDALDGLTPVTPSSVPSLAPGADTVFTAAYEVTQDDVDNGGHGAVGHVRNVATAVGMDPTADEISSPADATETAVVEGLSGISIDKISHLDDTNGNGFADCDEEITYSFEVTNTGTVTASNVVVTDPEVTGIVPASATIAPGDTVTFSADPYVVAQDDIDDGVVRNVAAVQADVPGGDTVEDEDIDTVDTVEAHPDLSVHKSSEITYDQHLAGKADVDDVISYTFTVTNTGGATAFDVEVQDPMAGLSAIAPVSAPRLAPGESADFTATYRVTRKDVTSDHIENVAAVNWVGPSRGGAAPVAGNAPSNVVVNATGGLATPQIVTKASHKEVALRVRANGTPVPVLLHDTVTVTGLAPGSGSQGRATLYGPSTRRTDTMCTPARAVKTVEFAAHNGTFRTPSIAVNAPGHYTWVVTTGADNRNEAAGHACGLASESTLVHRAKVGNVKVDTGHTGKLPGVSARRSAGGAGIASVSVPAIAMSAPIQTVGIRKGSMIIPKSVRRGGWLRDSASPGEAIGATVVAGHVSDRIDRPGAFGKLRKARKGQIVVVRDNNGEVHRYRITRIKTQSRAKGLSGKPVSSTGKQRLTLVTCTGKVVSANGRFTYTKNLVVIAKKID